MGLTIWFNDMVVEGRSAKTASVSKPFFHGIAKVWWEDSISNVKVRLKMLGRGTQSTEEALNLNRLR